jgi:hypothetical protein
LIALQSITQLKPKEIYNHLTAILETAEKGSVISKDNAVKILTKLCADKKYYTNCWPLLLDYVKFSLPNQGPSYAEFAASVVKEESKKEFIAALNKRLNEFEKESQRKRIMKVLKGLS